MTMMWTHRDGTVRAQSMNSRNSSVNKASIKTSIRTEKDASLRKTVVSSSIQNVLNSFSEEVKTKKQKKQPGSSKILSALSSIFSNNNNTSQTLASLIHSIRRKTNNIDTSSHDILQAMKIIKNEFTIGVLHCAIVSDSFISSSSSSSSCNCASVLRDKNITDDTVVSPEKLLKWKCKHISCLLDHMITVKKKVTTSTSMSNEAEGTEEEEEEDDSSYYMSIAKKSW